MAIRHAFRSLRRTPAFTIAALLTLVLGTASAGSMFAIVHGVLLAPLPYGEPGRLVAVGLESATDRRMGQPPALFSVYARHARSLDGVGWYRTGNANLWMDGDGAAPVRVTATWVSASTLPLLRATPLLGRAFTADEERAGDAVLLGESLWRTRFDAAPDVLGRTLMVNSVPREIVGVMPARFPFPTADTRVWLPARALREPVVGEFVYSGVARLAPGATAADAQRELAAVLPALAREFPRVETGSATATWLDDVRPSPVVTPLRDALTGGIARTLWLLAAAAALVLLVAWANVANLMLIRADGRQPELAVREALGASRWRIATHFLGESLLLGATACALALLLSYGAVRALVAFGPSDVPRLAELGFGSAAAGFVALVAGLGVLVCTAVGAGRWRRAGLANDLRAAGRGESTGRTPLRLRALLTALQIAVALVVTLGSALLLRTTHNLHGVHPGFDAANVTAVWTQLPFARYDDAASVAFYARLAERVAALPSVRSAGVAVRVPLGDRESLEQAFRVGAVTRTLPVNVVDDGWFAALGVPLVAGRGFGSAGRGTDVVISARAALDLFGDPDVSTAVGRELALAPRGPTYTVVGVAGDVRDRDLATGPVATVYRPQVVPADAAVELPARRSMAVVVKTGVETDALVPAIRRIVHELDATVPIFDVQSMDDVVRASTARLSFALALVTAAAAITLVLGAIGLYGVMAYGVALRTREFGVRVALGADPRRIARLVAARGLALTAGGIAAGFALYAMAAPFLRAFLFGVAPDDAATLAAATLVLAATASLASWLPARRAARVDPVEALRAE